ncbi:unnamed protein product [Pleuronectes platessa]|uniref:Uncharacterized protein n=1 Tax=Pleuronectes platessa TaxID=8262 RepID=A0A9N7YHK8_PLEPL|nr:unnamed protein product [Pleuronectes platessa]
MPQMKAKVHLPLQHPMVSASFCSPVAHVVRKLWVTPKSPAGRSRSKPPEGPVWLAGSPVDYKVRSTVTSMSSILDTVLDRGHLAKDRKQPAEMQGDKSSSSGRSPLISSATQPPLCQPSLGSFAASPPIHPSTMLDKKAETEKRVHGDRLGSESLDVTHRRRQAAEKRGLSLVCLQGARGGDNGNRDGQREGARERGRARERGASLPPASCQVNTA